MFEVFDDEVNHTNISLTFLAICEIVEIEQRYATIVGEGCIKLLSKCIKLNNHNTKNT